MSDPLKNLEDRIDKLIRYIDLIEANIEELREQIETNDNIDSVTRTLKRMSKILKSKDKLP